MVPDNETVQKLFSLFDNSLSLLKNSSTPLLFILFDIKDGLTEIFNITKDRLRKLIDKSEDPLVLEYASREIIQLERQLLDAKRDKIDYHSDLEYVKELLLLEKTIDQENITC